MKFIDRIEPYFPDCLWFLYKLLVRLDDFFYNCFFKYHFLTRLVVITFILAIFTLILLCFVLIRYLLS